MTDQEDHPPQANAAESPAETAIQRALRLKQARIEAREKPPRGGRFQREQAARVRSGAARPWMNK